MATAAPKWKWFTSGVAIVVLSASAFVWLRPHNLVHAQFGTIHTVEMSESYDETSLLRKGEVIVRKGLGLARLPRRASERGLPIGPAILGWSIRYNQPPNRTGYIYFNDVTAAGNRAPRWEFALTAKKQLSDVTRQDLECEFYGMNDPRGTNAFGTNYQGRVLMVPEGQVFFARLVANQTSLYAVRLAKQRGTPDWGTMRAEYVEISPANPRPEK